MVGEKLIGWTNGWTKGWTNGWTKWTKGSILTKIFATYKSEMPANSAGNYVTLHEFQSSHL